MKCPQCQAIESRVLETRVQKDGEIRRRRECLSCKTRFTTAEAVLVSLPEVVKKDGRREDFSSEKLRRGIQLACKKRPISIRQIDDIVKKVSGWAQAQSEVELSANVIGRKVTEELKLLDDVAYVRFASVYKTFRDVDEFVASLADRRGNP